MPLPFWESRGAKSWGPAVGRSRSTSGKSKANTYREEDVRQDSQSYIPRTIAPGTVALEFLRDRGFSKCPRKTALQELWL